jgi:hypothetical protein
MKRKFILVAALAALPLISPGKAEAREYCREYTKTIRIGGQVEIGYGQACKRGGDTWEIVKLSGPGHARGAVRERIYDDLYDRGYRVIVVNDYDHPHYDRRVRYVDYDRSRPALFGFYFSDNDDRHDYRRGHHHGHKYKKKHHGHHGHGRGHKKHH